MTGIANLKRYLSQFGRFVIVGVSNSIVDIGMTNALVYTFSPSSVQALFGISMLACLTATVNSYVLNRLWTFRSSQAKPDTETLIRFFLIALVAILINTSVFLFLYSYLERHFDVSKWLLLNISKVGGVVCASVFSFLGYKIGVFDRGSIQTFRDQFTFPDIGAKHVPVWHLAIVLAATCALRVIYCVVHPGTLNAADMVFPLISGVSLLIPVMLITRQLFGWPVALLSGWLCATHPRLVEFSCQGSAEAFYLLAYTTAVMWYMAFIGGKTLSALAFVCGITFAAGVVVHNELVIVVLLNFLVLHWVAIPSKGGQERFVKGRFTLCAALGFTLTILLYVAVAKDVMGMQRLDSYQGSASAISENILDMLRKLPGVLATPTVLFAFLLPFLAHLPAKISRTTLWPLWIMLLFPVAFYPFFSVEPQSFLSTIIPVQIFGAAGLTAFCAFLKQRLSWKYLYQAMVGAILIFSLAVIILRSL